MKGKFIVLTGCILCLMAGCGKETPSYYELGAEDLEGKKYQSAIENFELAIAEEKYEVEALRGEGHESRHFGISGCGAVPKRRL